jgi:hypothetical protein
LSNVLFPESPSAANGGTFVTESAQICGNARPDPGIFEQRSRPRDAVMEQQRVDPLVPSSALVDQRLAQPHTLTQLENHVRWCSRLRQPTLLHQLAAIPKEWAGSTDHSR